jgi:hypothetical protein
VILIDAISSHDILARRRRLVRPREMMRDGIKLGDAMVRMRKPGVVTDHLRLRRGERLLELRQFPPHDQRAARTTA